MAAVQVAPRDPEDRADPFIMAQERDRVGDWRIPERIIRRGRLYGILTNGRFRALVPYEYRQPLIREIHDVGHYGERLTNQNLQLNFFWPKMRADVIEYVKRCQDCRAAKPHKIPHREPMQFLPSDRFRCLHIDIVGKLPRSASGHEFLVTMIDRATRWLEAVPTRTVTAEAGAGIVMTHWGARFGIPDVIVSDQGPQF